MGQQKYSPVYFVGVAVYSGLFDSKLDINLSPSGFVRYLNFSSNIALYTLSHQQNKRVNIPVVPYLTRDKSNVLLLSN